MSKKILKRSLALGALMAFVITGSAWAAEVGASDVAEKVDRLIVSAGETTSRTDKKFNDIDDGVLQGGAINNKGTLTVTNCDFVGNVVRGAGLGSGAAIANFNGTLSVENCYFENNSSNSTKRGYGNAVFLSGGKATFTGNIFANNNGGRANGLIFAYKSADVTLDGNIFENNKDSTMLNIQQGAKLTLLNENKFLNNVGNDIFVRGTAIFAANSVTILKGGAQGLGIGDGAVVTLEEGSVLTAENGIGIDKNATKDTGLIQMKEGSMLEVGAASTIACISGESSTFKFLNDVDVTVKKNDTEGLTFAGSGTANDAVGDDVTKLFENFALNGSENPEMKLEEGKVEGERIIKFAVDENGDLVLDENQNVQIASQSKAVNKTNAALADNGTALKAHWRYHMNDMNKRMGELRMANGEAGVWTRMVRGEAEYEGAKAQYNQYQLGYDEKLSVDKRWTVGAAVTFAEGDSNFGKGSTEDDSTAFAIYGSKLNNDGTFVDLIARYAHLESDVTTADGKDDYSANGMSVSAEVGKRIQQGNSLWIEPQLELTYGSIDSAEYVIDGRKVYMDSMDSLIARLGFSLGKDVKQGNVYVRASYLYDFDGEADTYVSAAGATNVDKHTDDLGGGWWEVGVGANINLSKATYIYADVEKTFGGEVDTNWQWNLGIRYSF